MAGASGRGGSSLIRFLDVFNATILADVDQPVPTPINQLIGSDCVRIDVVRRPLGAIHVMLGFSYVRAIPNFMC